MNKEKIWRFSLRAFLVLWIVCVFLTFAKILPFYTVWLFVPFCWFWGKKAAEYRIFERRYHYYVVYSSKTGMFSSHVTLSEKLNTSDFICAVASKSKIDLEKETGEDLGLVTVVNIIRIKG